MAYRQIAATAQIWSVPARPRGRATSNQNFQASSGSQVSHVTKRWKQSFMESPHDAGYTPAGNCRHPVDGDGVNDRWCNCCAYFEKPLLAREAGPTSPKNGCAGGRPPQLIACVPASAIGPCADVPSPPCQRVSERRTACRRHYACHGGHGAPHPEARAATSLPPKRARLNPDPLLWP